MIDTLIAEIIARESVKDTNNPNDAGGRTKYGIAERWHPEVWNPGPPTLQQAQDIYRSQYFVKPGISGITPDYLMAQVADIAVNSGPGVAIQKLQEVLNSPVVDGVMGPNTVKLLATQNPEIVNTKLVMSRNLLLVRIVQKNPKDLEFLFGWVTRSQSFLRV